MNTYTTGDQRHPSVSMDADGDFVVAWEDYAQDAFKWQVYVRCFAADGTPSSGEIAVDPFHGNRQIRPSVSLDQDGDFVVAWQSYAEDGSDWGIYAWRFASDCTPLLERFRVNTYTTDRQAVPSVATDADGDLVVAWHSRYEDGDGYGIYAKRIPRVGSGGPGFRVNTYTTGDQRYPSVSMDVDGDFVVVWESSGQDGDGRGIYAQHFAADGTITGPEIRVNTYTKDSQSTPSVSMDADGDLVVAWQSWLQDGSLGGIYAQPLVGRGCYGEPVEAMYFNVAGGERLDCVSYSRISAHHLLVETGGELIFTAPAIGLGPETAVEAGATFKAGP